jgi:hypothetical protein
MTVTTNDIMKAAAILCQHLEVSGCKEVPLSELAYWAIPKEEEYDAYSEPTTHTLGDLDDDWSAVRRIADGTDAPVGYGLVSLAAVLRAVGQKVAC